ncbi:MAG: hydroxymethylglutaryl-CoA lyase [Tepidisphaera sp.]|nr:hydroxymethylglutaryl-CoA lyase [Tepidisphaera sp.]
MPSPTLVRITDVSPRDGLQNESRTVPTPDKAALVRAVAAANVDEIEVSSFVSAKWIPQLGDAAELFDILSREAAPLPLLSALVPNDKGMIAALDVNQRAGRALIGKVAVFAAASETFSKKNINASIAESLERFVPVIAAAHQHALPVRGYISCVIACPFEGPIAPAAVASLSRRLLDMGVDEIDLGDTIGAATPQTTRVLLDAVHAACPELQGGLSAQRLLTLHLHDTFGRAGACASEAMRLGVRSFDGAVGGLGGCPYASTPGHRAPGNISLHALRDAIASSGLTTQLQLKALDNAATLATSLTRE